MAKATIVEKEVPVVVTTTTVKKFVTLEIDEYTAEVLKQVVGGIVGSIKKSPRGVMDKVYYALESAGVKDLADFEYKCMEVGDNKTAEEYLLENK